MSSEVCDRVEEATPEFPKATSPIAKAAASVCWAKPMPSVLRCTFT